MRDLIMELESRFWNAAGDPDFYEDHFADDGVMAFHVGMMDKQAVLESMRGAPEWKGFSIDEPRIVAISDDVASITYSTSATAYGDEVYEAYVTSVYVNRDGRWQLIVHQQTPRAG